MEGFRLWLLAGPPAMLDMTGRRRAVRWDRRDDKALARLCAEFPELPQDVISSVLDDSLQTVVEASGQRLVQKGEELARIRLEVRTRHPARCVKAGPMSSVT